MFNSNIVERVLKVRNAHGAGTAFTIDIGEKQYVVSANHVFGKEKTFKFAKTNPNDNKEIWETPDTELPHCDKQKDVIVFPLKKPITPSHEWVLEGGTPGLGQDVYFLGFPFAWANFASNVSNIDKKDFSVPFIKRGIIAAYGDTFSSSSKDIYMDTYSNHGFSGAPVIILNDDKKIQVIGIFGGCFASGYNFDDKGSLSVGMGIAYASSIKNAIGLIEEYEALKLILKR